jgi:hypothetical protein
MTDWARVKRVATGLLALRDSLLALVASPSADTAEAAAEAILQYSPRAQGPKGEPGDVGTTGDEGPQGEQGVQGPQGVPGVQGVTGIQGVPGDEGPQGVQGDEGPQGAQGEKGDQGNQGLQGIQGVPGPSDLPAWVTFPSDTMVVASTDSITRPILLSSHLPTDSSGSCEAIRLNFVKPAADSVNAAKVAIAFYDGADLTPGHAKAWLQCHDYLATPDSGGNNRHRHFSIETANAAGTSVNTRLSVPYGTDVVEISTFSSNFSVRDGVLAVNGSAGTNRDLKWGGPPSSNLTPDGSHWRWTARAGSAAEAGADAGSNWWLMRHADNGTINSTPVLYAQRSNGQIGIGTSAPTQQLDIVGTANGNLRVSRATIASFTSLILATGATDIWAARMPNTNVSGTASDWHFRNVADGVTAMVMQKRATQANISLLSATVTNYGGGVGAIWVEDASTEPTSAPLTGCLMWFKSGAMKIWPAGAGAAKTVTAL